MGQQQTLAEKVAESKRAIDRSVRELERERRKLEQNEVKMTQEIKKMAQKGQTSTCKVLARDIVRSRNQINKMFEMRSSLQGLSMQMATIKSTEAISSAMKNASQALIAVDKALNLPELQKVMKEFAINNEKMEMKSELMSEGIDMALESTTDTAEEEKLVSQVLDEMGINVNASLSNAPNTLQQQQTNQNKQNDVSEFEARLKGLQNS